MNESLNLLVVDDSKDDRLLCRRALSKALEGDINFTEASSGSEAIKVLETSSPDCILLDYSLPGKNGLEVLEIILDSHPQMPVIMLTGQGNEEIAVQAIKLGAQEYITKSSINKDSLYLTVKAAIEHSAMQVRLSEQNKALTLFSKALAHDLKEPVRTIRSFLGLINHEALSEADRRYFEVVNISACKMYELIEVVLNYVNLAAVSDIKRELCDVGNCIEKALANLETLLEQKDINCKYTDMPDIQADEGHIIQLFENLIANSIQHSDKEKVEIEINYEQMDNLFQFSVSDNGPGIEERFWEEVFDPFRRFSREKTSGFGIGLSICKRIVETHEGKMWCRSNDGPGSKFFFTIKQ